MPRPRAAPAFAALVLLVVGTAAVFAGQLAPTDPLAQVLDDRLRPPALFGGPGGHLLGTDHVGRDILSRLMYGGRASLTIGALSVLASGVVGVGLGITAGFRGGWLDEAAMRLVEIQNAFPFLVFAIAVVAIAGSSLTILIVTLAVWGWGGYARIIRGEVLSLREREFILAARATGGGGSRILVRHLLPNVAPTVLVLATFQVAQLIIAESSLSFLGLGVPAPTPSWGSMLADGRGYLDGAWWIAGFPIAAIMATVLSVNVLGDALRDRSDPRLRR